MVGIKSTLSKTEVVKKNAVLTKSDIKKMYTDVEKVLGVKVDRNQTSPEKIQQLLQKMNAGRSNVGSVNPYAAIEHELGITIDWKRSKPDAIERLLKKKCDESVYLAVSTLSVSLKKTRLQKKPSKIPGRKKS